MKLSADTLYFLHKQMTYVIGKWRAVFIVEE